MRDKTTLPDFLMALANTAHVTWSIATFGAIAEFSYGPEEDITVTLHDEGVNMITSRGALLYRHFPNAKVVAYEGLSKHPELWSQGISICLPEHEAQKSARTVLTESGLDHEALMIGVGEQQMFDIGIGTPHVDAFVRTSDSALVSVLREHTGEPLFGDNTDALHAILNNSPDRVFASSLGRIEVNTPIAHEDGETATGPHTHVLPDLLALDRTHAANAPIPEGYLPCMNIFPPNPARDSRGNARDFDKHDHTVFQDILTEYGDDTSNGIKQQVRAAIAAGEGPESLVLPETGLNRNQRTALRVVLRQCRFMSGQSATVDQWLSVYEPNKGAD